MKAPKEETPTVNESKVLLGKMAAGMKISAVDMDDL